MFWGFIAVGMPAAKEISQPAPGIFRRCASFIVLFSVWHVFISHQLFGLCADRGALVLDCSGLEQGNEGEAACATSAPAHPIFMLPGIAGSGLMVSAKNASLPLCSSSPVSFPVPFRVWASLSLVRPPRSHQLCWMDIMQPVADEKGEIYASKEGVNVEVR